MQKEIEQQIDPFTIDLVFKPTQQNFTTWCNQGFGQILLTFADREQSNRGKGFVVLAGLEPVNNQTGTIQLVPAYFYVTEEELLNLFKQMRRSPDRPKIETAIKKVLEIPISKAITTIQAWIKQHEPASHLLSCLLLNQGMYLFHYSRELAYRQNPQILVPGRSMQDEKSHIFIPTPHRTLLLIFQQNRIPDKQDFLKRVYVFNK